MSVDNIGYVSTISIPVEGSDTQKTVVEVADDKGNTEILGEYNVDFTTMTVSEVRFDKDVLVTMFGVTEPTETQAPSIDTPFDQGTTFSDPAGGADIIDNNNYEDWWNSIINSY